MSSALIRGNVGCSSYNSLPCRDVDVRSPEGARTFAKADEKSGDNDLIRYSLEYTESYGAGGDLASVTVRGRFQTDNNGGGTAVITGTYDGSVEDVEGMLVTGSMSATLSGSEFIVSDIDFSVSVDCEVDEYEIEAEADAGASEPNSTSKTAVVNGRVEGSDSCSFDVAVFVDSATNREAPGEHGSTDLQFEVTFTVIGGQSEACDGLSGVVYDGDAASGHQNPLPGIRVELQRAGNVVRVTPTDDAGHYCFESDDGVEPGDYLLRATLIDATRATPFFETRHRGAGEAVFIEVAVTAEAFGVDRPMNVEFAAAPGKDWLPDVANIHWQSERFARWLTVDAGLTAEVVRPFIVDAFSTHGTSYRADTRTARINSDGGGEDDSRYADRNEPGDEGPENAEWHEIGHHVSHSLGIAPTNTAPACANRIPHGGWLNATTCDSVAEGFATWIAAVASLDIDANRGPGYGDAVYSVFGSLESNGWRPWSWFTSQATNRDHYREDFAFSELLWDLGDDTPDERGNINLTDPADPVPDDPWVYSGEDRVALGGANLLGILGQIRPTTVDELYRGLLEHPSVPSNLKTADANLLGDEAAEMSPLMEVFLLHGFHPIDHEADPRYVVGEIVGRTDHASGGGAVVPRPHIERIPSSNVLLRNSTPNEVSFEIAVDAGVGSWRRTVVVPANGERLAYVEVPTYWPGILPDGAALPACGGEGQAVVTITLSAPGFAARTLDSCEYLQAVAAAAGDAAVTYGVPAEGAPVPSAAGAGGEPSTAGGSGPPIVLVGVAVAIIVLAVVAVGILRRRGADRG